jgi:hypothetical protein
VTTAAIRAPYTSVRLGARKGTVARSSITVAISQALAAAGAFEVTAEAFLGTEGIEMVARVRLPALIATQRAARVVLMCSCPGATGWDVRVTPLDPAAAGGFISVALAHDLGGRAAIPLNGAVLLAGGPDAGAYNHAAGTGAGTATIPAGARVNMWTTVAGGAPSTVIITSPIFGVLPTITVPTGLGIGDAPENLVGPATIAFSAAAATWFANWRELR